MAAARPSVASIQSIVRCRCASCRHRPVSTGSERLARLKEAQKEHAYELDMA